MGRSVKEEILSLLFPRRCPICDEIVSPKGKKICDRCKGKAYVIEQPYCYRCGKPLDKMTSEYCYDCERSGFSYKRGRALFPYSGNIKRSVEMFKFHGRQEYASWYGEEMAKYLGDFICSLKVDCLMPIPIHRSKRLKRGYNQAELLADEIGRILEIPVDSTSLTRIRKTLPQKELNDKERLKNLQRAFQICDNVVQYKKVILVDDIYTTGSTIEACTQVLMGEGVKEVYFICLCIGYGY